MDTLFPDYQKLVIEYYHWKKRHNKLRSELGYPTQAKLKRECVRLCKDKIQKKDEKVIRDFCEDWDDKKTCLQNIGNYDVDKFKALSNFLKKGSGSTDPKNIELLAWLIDFKARPYDFDKDYSAPLIHFLKIWGEVQDSVDSLPEPVKVGDLLTVKEKSDDGEDLSGAVIGDGLKGNERASAVPEKAQQQGLLNVEKVPTSVTGPDANGGKRKPKLQILKVVVVVALLFVVGGGGYWLYSKQGPDGGCMYWTGDHYEPIPCNQKVPNKLIVALDTAKVNNFRKIPPDKITRQSIGLVWYSKIDNEVEFFTASGNHPVVIYRHLKPITGLIVDKYGRQNTVSSP